MWIFDKLLDAGGKLIGLAEKAGIVKYPVKNYQFQVTHELWRGSRLNLEGYKVLKRAGFTTVINLCAENTDDTLDAMTAGLKAVLIPVIDNTAPISEQIYYFLNTVSVPDSKTYVHCEAGKGRTGVFVACYRIYRQGWSINDAIAEAVNFGLRMPCQMKFIREWGESLTKKQVQYGRAKRR